MPTKHTKHIAEPSAPLPVGPFLDCEAAAAFLGLSPKTLDKLRWAGQGPVFYALGRRRMYTKGDLQEWAMARRRTSTSSTAA